MKIKIVEDEKPGQERQVLKEFELNENIQIPVDSDIYISIPDGVYRCNINEGMFPEDRRFLQKRESVKRETYVIRYHEVSHHTFPVLNLKIHYSGGNDQEDLFISFKPSKKRA